MASAASRLAAMVTSPSPRLTEAGYFLSFSCSLLPSLFRFDFSCSAFSTAKSSGLFQLWDSGLHQLAHDALTYNGWREKGKKNRTRWTSTAIIQRDRASFSGVYGMFSGDSAVIARPQHCAYRSTLEFRYALGYTCSTLQLGEQERGKFACVMESAFCYFL